MKEQINPSYSNRIYVENTPHIQTSSVEIMNNDKEWFLEYEFDPYIMNDYIAVTMKAMYVEKVIGGDTKVPRITVRIRYKIEKDHDFTSTELYPIVTHSTGLLIERFNEAPIEIRNLTSIPTCPLLSDMKEQLEELAETLNQVEKNS